MAQVVGSWRFRTGGGRNARVVIPQTDRRKRGSKSSIERALREYSKTNPAAVQAFMAQNDTKLSGLSKREGMLWMTGRKPRQRE
ncbi:MAG: DNA alkylation repair protein [Dehalococcoidia bacterium]|nr:DNA alkylation repair protein [Dehalococcoidia bacterium]